LKSGNTKKLQGKKPKKGKEKSKHETEKKKKNSRARCGGQVGSINRHNLPGGTKGRKGENGAKKGNRGGGPPAQLWLPGWAGKKKQRGKTAQGAVQGQRPSSTKKKKVKGPKKPAEEKKATPKRIPAGKANNRSNSRRTVFPKKDTVRKKLAEQKPANWGEPTISKKKKTKIGGEGGGVRKVKPQDGGRLPGKKKEGGILQKGGPAPGGKRGSSP